MKQSRWLAALVVGAFLSLGAVAFAVATGPQFVPGNPECKDLGFDHELKSDTGDSNTVSMLIDGFLVEAEVAVDLDGIYFDFYTNVPVKGVIAKGGPDANFYDYRPGGVLSDTGLVSPISPNGEPYGLSHVSFCFDTPVVPYSALGVTKDAAGTYDRTVDWELTKSVDPVSHTGVAGQLAGSSIWTVVATKTVTEDNFKVAGSITITNPNTIDVDFTVADELSDGTVAVVTCPAYTVPAKFGTTPGEVVCTYEAFPNDATARTNTVDVSVSTPLIPQADLFDAAILWGTPVTDGYDEGTLSDPRFGFSELISETTTETFPDDFRCSADASDYTNGTYEYTETNTAGLNGNIGLVASASVTVECRLPALEVTKTAEGSYDRTVAWDLTKSVDPDFHSGGPGDSFDSLWSVVATKSETLGNYAVAGTISIFNPAAIAQAFTLEDTLTGAREDLVAVDCPALVVAPGATVECTYDVSQPDGTADLNTVVVTAAGNSSVTATAPVAFTENLIGDDEGTLSDERFNYVAQINASNTVDFPETFECSTDASMYVDGFYTFTETNTASLNGNIGLVASASVTVECRLPALEVTKTAEGSYDRTVAWDLTKSVDDDEHTGYAGELAGSSIWTVVATKSDTPSNFKVAGDITITNNAAIDQIFSVSDVLDDGSVAGITCPGTSDNTGTVPAGGSVICTYEAFPTDDTATLNTATVSAAGNAVQTATAPVSFTENLIGDDETTLSDPRVAYSQLITVSTTETFPEDFACPADASLYTNGVYEYTETNTAYLDGDNTDLEASADVKVTCTLPALEVVKTAAGEWDRVVIWDLTKTVNPASHTGYAGEEAGTSTWTVVATKTDSGPMNFRVSGSITIDNPAAIAQAFTLEDTLTGGAREDVVTVECPSDTVPAGGQVVCTYEASQPDAAADLNTVVVTADGNTPQTATADVGWKENLEGYDEGLLEDKEFTFSQMIDDTFTTTFDETYFCPADDGQYVGGKVEFEPENTATLNGNINLSARATVKVTCYVENLEVSKTVDTSYVREHLWSIDKTVATANGEMLDGYPKVWLYVDGSGDETATWTVDVTYDGYEDRDYSVAGTITIENKGFDAVIESVDDVLGGTTIDVCGGLTFPYTLHAGETLECDYYEDGEYKGDNVVTVTTERDTYSDTKAIVWGDPTTEINDTITVVDDLFGVEPLGTVAAPNDAQFTYTKDYAWTDYGADGCGSFEYVNTATIVETKQSASATLKVNVQCYLDDTAYAMGDDNTCFIPAFSRWGWTNEAFAPGTYTWPVYAGAADCDLDKGTYAGEVTVSINGGVDVKFHLEEGFELMEEHVYAGSTMFPQVKRGRRTVDTVAPGQYYIEDDLSGDIDVIVHAVVMYPDPNFGPMD